MAFGSKRIFNSSPALIPPLAEALERQLVAEGYEVKTEGIVTGGMQVSLSKGGMFKKVAGLKTALNVKITPSGNSILVDASIGVFGQQLIPSAITLLVFWPMIIPQIWGLVQQSQLDDHVMSIITQVLGELRGNGTAQDVSKGLFCPSCGARVGGGKFCQECGAKL